MSAFEMLGRDEVWFYYVGRLWTKKKNGIFYFSIYYFSYSAIYLSLCMHTHTALCCLALSLVALVSPFFILAAAR